MKERTGRSTRARATRKRCATTRIMTGHIVTSADPPRIVKDNCVSVCAESPSELAPFHRETPAANGQLKTGGGVLAEQKSESKTTLLAPRCRGSSARGGRGGSVVPSLEKKKSPKKTLRASPTPDRKNCSRVCNFAQRRR